MGFHLPLNLEQINFYERFLIEPPCKRYCPVLLNGTRLLAPAVLQGMCGKLTEVTFYRGPVLSDSAVCNCS